MKTKDEIRKYAEGLAWDHFYSGDDIPWEPFENKSKEWLDEQCEDLADAIETAMLWAQGEMK
jgi:hypothetical protein